MKILTISSVFPNSIRPFLGLFVYQRMNYVAQKHDVIVVSPVPWSPFDIFIRIFKKQFRLKPKSKEFRNRIVSFYLPFFCLPGIFKSLDGFFYYISILKPVSQIIKKKKIDIIDVHFTYPDGMAAMLFAKTLSIPFCITMRGTEFPHSQSILRKKQMEWVYQQADRIICVSRSLSRIALKLGADSKKIRIIPNGINTDIFYPRDSAKARKKLGLSADTKVILSVGGLVKRKGFHRIIELLPEIKKSYRKILFLIVGGETVEGDYSNELRALVKKLKLEKNVSFEGIKPPDTLPYYYSASDLFVLATSNEGWPNVIVESLACGCPVIGTDVGGIKEIISAEYLGNVVPFNDDCELKNAIQRGLDKEWNKSKIKKYAHQRSWNNVAEEVIETFNEVLSPN